MMKCLFAIIPSVLLVAACSGADAPQSSAPPQPVEADTVEIVRGVPDRDDDAVVAVAIGDTGLCSGTLIARNLVLTARHCVSETSEQVSCPDNGAPQIRGDRDPASLHILVGPDVAHAELRANGKAVVVPPASTLCGDDIALIILDRPIAGISPLEVRDTGVAKGDHVRAVGFGQVGDGGRAGVKLERAHVRVLDTSDREFLVGEATCRGDSGGPALDETTGAVVGVVSRGGPQCDGSGAHNVYTRTDVFYSLINDAMVRAAHEIPLGPPVHPGDADAGAPKPSNKAHSDMGAACQAGSDCSAGVCVVDRGKQYCSRDCGTGDRCPAHFHCTKAGAKSVCTEA